MCSCTRRSAIDQRSASANRSNTLTTAFGSSGADVVDRRTSAEPRNAHLSFKILQKCPQMVQAGLSKDKKVACLWFNGWAFQGFDDAKTVLIEATITELMRQRSGVGKVKELGKKLLKRVDWPLPRWTCSLSRPSVSTCSMPSSSSGSTAGSRLDQRHNKPDRGVDCASDNGDLPVG